MDANSVKATAVAAGTAKANSPAKAGSRNKSQPNRKSKPAITAQTIQFMIAESAYYLAEQRGFTPGYEMQDWIEAERLIQGSLPQK